MATQNLTQTPTALAGIVPGRIYYCQARSASKTYFQASTTAPTSIDAAFNVGVNGTITFRAQAGESVYVWGADGGGKVVYTNAQSFNHGRRSGTDDSNIVFLEAQQSADTTATNNAWLSLGLHPASFLMTDRASGKASFAFNVPANLTYSSSRTTDVDFQLRLMGSFSDTENGTFTTAEELSVVNGSSILYRQAAHLTSDTNHRQQMQGYIPFALDDLPATFADGKYIRFGIDIKINSVSTPSAITISNTALAFTAFGHGYGIPPALSITEGMLADNSVSTRAIQNGAITTDKINSSGLAGSAIQDGSITSSKLGNQSVTSSAIASGAVSTGKLASASVSQSKLQSGAVGTNQIAADAITLNQLANLHPGSNNAGKAVILNAAGDALEFGDVQGGGGGGISSVAPSNLDGVSGGASDANKIIRANYDGTQFVADAELDPGDLNGITTGSGAARNLIGLSSDGSQFENYATLKPARLGLTEGAGSSGKVVAINSSGDDFELVDAASGGGATQTLSSITGVLATTKGGTGIIADDLTDLRSKLGIGQSNAEPKIKLQANADLQPNDTIERVSSASTSTPSGLADGIIVRNGNDQFALDLETGKQWRRSLTDNNDGVWTEPAAANPVLATIANAAGFVSMDDGDIGIVISSTWMPRYNDNTQPSKVIVTRHGDYLLALNRNNAWWANRITDNSATFISWQWAANSRVPAGLVLGGGEKAEEAIPAGEAAILSGQSGIDGGAYIYVLVEHTLDSQTGVSTYKAYFVDDDADLSIFTATNTRGYTTGTWARTRLDVGGISDNIFVEDTDEDGNTRPAFVGVVPEISNLHFGGYTLKASAAGMVAGDVFYSATNRTLYVIHKATDTHLDSLFNIDFEVSIFVDDANYVRGVFTAVANIPPIGNTPAITGAAFRADDLQSVGTLDAGDVVALRGHKSVITKTDTIQPVNLGITHGADVANQAVLINSSGSGFSTGTAGVADGSITSSKLADDSVIASKIAGVETGADESGKALVLDSTGLAITTATIQAGSGTPADNSITTAMLQNDIITAAKVADGAIGSDALASDSIINSKVSDGAIHTANLADSSITRVKVGADAIDGTKISDDSIGSEHISDGAIGNSALAADAVDGGKISDDSIGSEHLIDGSVGGSALASSAVGTTALAADSVTSAKIASGAVDSTALGASSVTSAKVASGAIGTSELANSSITSAKINSGAVDSSALGASSVTTSAIASGAVTNGKIATGAVSSSSMASNSITPTEVAGITPGASIGGHSLVLSGDGTTFTTSASGGSGGGANDSSGRVYLAEAGGTDTTNAYSSSGTKTETETLYTTPVKMHDRATGGAVFYFTATLQHNSTHSQSWSAKLQARWASSAAAVASATNWTDCDIFNTSDIFLNETITGANRNINHDYSIALPFELADLPTGAVDGQFIQYRVVYSLSANSASGATPVTWIRRARRYYGVGLTGGTGTIADGTITNAMLADDCVGTENLAAGAVNETAIAAGAVGSTRIASDAIRLDHILDLPSGSAEANKSVVLNNTGSALTVADLRGDGSVLTAMLEDGAVTSAKLGDGSVVATRIRNDAVFPTHLSGVDTGADESGKYIILDTNGTGFSTTSTGGGGGTPADNSITTAMLQNDSVTAAKINDGAVGTAALASDSVNGSKIADDAIDASHLSTGSVGSDALAADAVGSSAIGAGAVDTDALAADSVNGSKIADDAIGSEHLIDGSVSTAALASSSVTPAKINNITTGSDSANKVLALNASGDAFTLVEQSSGGGGGGGGGSGSGMPVIYNTQADGNIPVSAVSSTLLTISATDYAALTNGDRVFLYDTGGYSASQVHEGIHTISKFSNNRIQLISVGNIRVGANSFSGNGTPANIKVTKNLMSVYLNTFDSGTFTTTGLETDAWQLSGKATKFFQYDLAGLQWYYSASQLKTQLQVGYSSTEDGTYTWLDCDQINVGNQFLPLAGGAGSQELTYNVMYPLRYLPSAVTDDAYIKFRVYLSCRLSGRSGFAFYNTSTTITILDELGTQTIGGGSGGGSSTPADNSITTAMLQDDSVTEAKLANDSVRAAAIADNAITNSAVLDHTLELDKIASQYQSTGNYTFQSNVVSGVDDGKFGYTNGSNQTGQIAFNMLATDAGAVSQFLDNRWVVLWKNALNYVVGQQDGAAQTIQGDNTQGEFDLDNVHVVGSFANGDTIKLYYGSVNRPHSVAKINHFGDMGVGLVEPDSLGITAGAVNSNRIIQVDSTGTGFQAAIPASVGLVKHIMIMKQEISGSQEKAVSTTNENNRTFLDTQTGEWTMANRSTGFISFLGAGLAYFGHIPAQPICLDVAVIARWKSGSETYQSWLTTNSRVEEVNLGTDRLGVVKLFAGGAIGAGSIALTGSNPVNNVTYTDNPRSDSHVDCAVSTGFKTIKLSEMPTGITDGTDFQLTLAFRKQTPSPNFTARRWFLRADILDGAMVSANY